MQEEVLIITNYFPPEKGAAPNRIFTLAKALHKNNYNVSVVCPLPNYPYGNIFNGYRGRLSVSENLEGITIKRLWLIASKSKNKFIRLFSMLSFAVFLFLYLIFKKTPKKVIIQCSPLFVGFFAVLASKLKRKTIILNVSDLWPLAGLQMGILNKGFYYSVLERLEYFNYKNAQLILGQSEEILTHITRVFPKQQTLLYRNFPDFPITNKRLKNSTEIRIVYAGLLGIAQGVLAICKAIDLPDGVSLTIYGDGPEANSIAAFCKQHPKISYKGLLNRDELHDVLRGYDVTLIPLINRIYGSVPSKIFEYSRLGLPIIYFSEGEGSDLVLKHRLGWVIQDSDYEALNTLINALTTSEISLIDSETILKTVSNVFDFDKQFKDVLNTINSL